MRKNGAGSKQVKANVQWQHWWGWEALKKFKEESRAFSLDKRFSFLDLLDKSDEEVLAITTEDEIEFA